MSADKVIPNASSTISQLVSFLSEVGVELPGTRQKKEFYLVLLNKYLSEKKTNSALTATAADK